MALLFPILFVLVPIIEIAAFIEVGGLIGLWPTLVTIVLTAVIGTALLRRQGLQTLAQAQKALNEGRMPVESAIDGISLLVSALLLLTPGFFTDAIGFALLVRPVRLGLAKWVWARAHGRFHVHVAGQNGEPETWPGKDTGEDAHTRPPVIEGEIVERDGSDTKNDTRPAEGSDPDRRSPWNRR